MKITTTYHGPTTYPKCAWTAIDEDTYDGAPDSRTAWIGYGDTEIQAVRDLLLQIEYDTEQEMGEPSKFEKLLQAIADTIVMSSDEEIELLSSENEPQRAAEIIQEVLNKHLDHAQAEIEVAQSKSKE